MNDIMMATVITAPRISSFCLLVFSPVARGSERGAGERAQPSGQHGAALRRAGQSPGAGGYPAEGRSLPAPAEQETPDASGRRVPARRKGDDPPPPPPPTRSWTATGTCHDPTLLSFRTRRLCDRSRRRRDFRQMTSPLNCSPCPKALWVIAQV